MKFTYPLNRKRTDTITIDSLSDDDHIFKLIAKSKCFYEIDLLEYILFATKRSRSKNCLSIDIGANIGNHSIYFGKYVSSSVLCIEANPAVIPVLKKNLANNIDNYVVSGCALGAKADTGVINFPDGAEHNLGMAKVIAANGADNSGNQIAIKTLDSVLEENSQVLSDDILLLKIDVEGAEVDVLRGADKTLGEHHPHIFVEAATESQRAKVNDLLSPYGYQQISRWATTPVYHYCANPSFNLKLRTKIYQFLFRVRKKLKRASDSGR